MIAHLEISKNDDLLYIALVPSAARARGPIDRSERVGANIVLDFDKNGQLTGIEIMEASKVVNVADLSALTANAFAGVKEAAELAGVEKSNFVRDFANKPDFPKPLVEVASGRIWLRKDVEQYLSKIRRSSTTTVMEEAKTEMLIKAASVRLTPSQQAAIEKGKNILAITKTLKSYSIGEPRIASFLSATLLAGRSGLLASALRGHRKLSPKKFDVFCGNQGLGIAERSVVTAWLEKSGLVAVDRAKGEILSYTNTTLAYESILRAVIELFDSLNPTEQEQACISLLETASHIPRTLNEVKTLLSRNFKEDVVSTALSLARGFKIVQERSGKGLREPVIFSPRIWTKNAEKIAGFLSSLDRTQREVVSYFVEKVREYQGYPYDLLFAEARKHNAVPLLEMCVHVGMMARTEIVTADAQRKAFLTSPHFFAEVAAQHGDDVCDRVKIFLDSIRNGQHYGRPGTGKIFDPTLLLRKLLNSGEIGPCTAIGTDYVVPEKEGIVRVRRSQSKPGQAVMELIQKDTVEKVYGIVSRKFIDAAVDMGASNVRDERQFLPDEQIRGQLGELPAPMQEAERALILAIRE